MKCLLFINGEAPVALPDDSVYQLIACTDGAFDYLKEMKFQLNKLHFISGDFDSFPKEEMLNWESKLIETPDQNKTDLTKALEILIEKGAKEVDIYGASGKEQDHFLGNIGSILHFNEVLKIQCIDNYSKYYFLEKKSIIKNVLHKTVSLFPFPEAKNISTKGLKWSLKNEDLNITRRIGTRNIAIENEVEIEYSEGNLLVFISK